MKINRRLVWKVGSFLFGVTLAVGFYKSRPIVHRLQAINPLERLSDSLDTNKNRQSIISSTTTFNLKDATEQKVKSENTIKILLWYAPFKQEVPRTIFSKKCGSCEITYNKSLISDKSTKAVVFHYSEIDVWTLPTERREDQYYVWWSEESPNALRQVAYLDFAEYDNFFNLTMTYRRDSDIYAPYGTAEISYINGPIEGLTKEYTQDELWRLFHLKTKLASWIVSNCGGSRGSDERMAYVHVLTAYGLKLDQYGDCSHSPHIPKDGMEQFLRPYKFYLSFENIKLCQDYITEKFFKNALMYGAVPVVYGASKADYDAVAPPYSYIYAGDYTTASLVKYLNYLDKNNTAYMEYFNWRKLPIEKMPNYGKKTKWCQLCEKLHTSSFLVKENEKQVVPSLKDWFYGKENKDCLKD